MKLTSLNELIREGEVVKGKWELDENHELLYRARRGEEEVKFKGTLVSVEPGTLVFSTTQKQANGKLVASLFKLTGSWQVDPKNRIVFEVEKKRGKTDKLTFQGTWEVGSAHEIIYTYERTRLKTKTKETQSLVFKGYWDISERHRLTFYLGGDSDSALRFRGAFQTKRLVAKEGEIRYQIGVEVRGRTRLQTVTLFGKWKLARDLELSFEIEYGEGERKAILFGGTYFIGDGTSLEIKLKARDGAPLGAELVLTKEIFGEDGQMFVRLQKTLEESSLEAGVRLRW
jgi:hypothetical protein